MTVSLPTAHAQAGPDSTGASTLELGHPGARFLVAAYQVAARTMKKFVRTPSLIVAGAAQGALFLLIFRYVFGGAIGHLGSLSYVDFLVPGFVVTGLLFTGIGSSTGIADDIQAGLFDRLRSLPIRLLSIVSGRVAADSCLMVYGMVVTILIGVLVGFRTVNGAGDAAVAFALTVLYGFSFLWMFVSLGLLAGGPQAAQGISFLVFPLSFVSSAYIPVSTMPGWMQAFAAHQPMTYMVDTVRILCEGQGASSPLGHPLGSSLLPSVVWAVGLIAVFAPVTVATLRRA
ncbi:MAG TPA: ABC transporter permease [Acidimicrobiales bacterium]|nr:ABC transporter permease [Acidimicrobiales bacterium]